MLQESSRNVCKILIAIPHYFKETQGGTGYGSGQEGARLQRTIALARCLQGLKLQRRTLSTALLNIKNKHIEYHERNKLTNQRIQEVEIEIHLFCNNSEMISELTNLFNSWITVHNLNLDNPKMLPVAARDWLIKNGSNCTLYAYMEDDIVITDNLFFDKQLWFLERTNHQAVLMPHRFEQNFNGDVGEFLVDGPLNQSFIDQFYTPEEKFAHGMWNPNEGTIWFDRFANPHSGCFVISDQQRKIIMQESLNNDGFVSPLETAATLTVMKHFPILKPSLINYNFLLVEHAHPTFSCLLNQWESSYV